MSISYNRMMKRMIDMNVKPKGLKNLADVSQNILAKINKNDPIIMDSLGKICEALKCNTEDVMEFIPFQASDSNREV